MTHDDLIKEIEQRIGDTCGLWISDEAAAAVLRVCVEELLGREVTKMEWRGNCKRPTDNAIDVVNRLLGARRALYSPPKPKTPEERVTIQCAGGRCDVYLDHEWRYTFGQYTPSEREEHARIYRLGLIAELKQKEQSC